MANFSGSSSNRPEARKQNVICILPRDADGNLAELVTANDIRLELVSLGADTETTLTFDIISDQDGWRVVYSIGGQPQNICINLYICEALVLKGPVRAETPASAVTRAQAIVAKRDAATQADADDLVAIGTAFPTDVVVQYNVCYALWNIVYCGRDGSAHKVLVAGGHRVAVAALGSTDAEVLKLACWVLYRIAVYGGADARAAICAVDGTLIDKLRHASDVIRAAGVLWPDWAATLEDIFW